MRQSDLTDCAGTDGKGPTLHIVSKQPGGGEIISVGSPLSEHEGLYYYDNPGVYWAVSAVTGELLRIRGVVTAAWRKIYRRMPYHEFRIARRQFND